MLSGNIYTFIMTQQYPDPSKIVTKMSIIKKWRNGSVLKKSITYKPELQMKEWALLTEFQTPSIRNGPNLEKEQLLTSLKNSISQILPSKIVLTAKKTYFSKRTKRLKKKKLIKKYYQNWQKEDFLSTSTTSRQNSPSLMYPWML